MSSRYTDPPLRYSEQIERLKQRGMRFLDERRAEHYLRHLNYSRLAAYWNGFLIQNSNPPRFRNETTFERILDLYRFDRELRLLVLDAIERIEISFRSVWAYEVAHAPGHGPFAHLNPTLARDKKRWSQNLQRLVGEMHRAFKEPYIRSFLENHSDTMPPVWTVCEVMSLGSLSNWYANLNDERTRMAIAKHYGIGHSALGSWMHHLTVVRNVCAHHGIYWNREINIQPESTGGLPDRVKNSMAGTPRKPHNTFVILLWLLDRIAGEHHWRARLNKLMGKYRPDLRAMGFPEKWRELPIWKEAKQ